MGNLQITLESENLQYKIMQKFHFSKTPTITAKGKSTLIVRSSFVCDYKIDNLIEK